VAMSCNPEPLVSACADTEVFNKAGILQSDDGKVGGSQMKSFRSGTKGPNTEVEKLMDNYRSMMSLHEKVRSRIHFAEHGSIGVASTMSTLEMLDAIATQKSRDPEDLTDKEKYIQCFETRPGSSGATPFTDVDNVIDFAIMTTGDTQSLSLSTSRDVGDLIGKTETIQCSETSQSHSNFTPSTEDDDKENCHAKIKSVTEFLKNEEILVKTRLSPRIKTHKSLNSQFDNILTENNGVSCAGIENLLIDANKSEGKKRANHEKLIVSTGTPSTDADSVEPDQMHGDDIEPQPETPLSVRKLTASDTEMISPGSFFLRYGIGSGTSKLDSDPTIVPVASSCINYSNSFDHFRKDDSDCETSLSSYRITERASKDGGHTEKKERRKSEPFGIRNGPITFIKTILCGQVSTTPDWTDIRSSDTEDLMVYEEHSEMFSSYSQSLYEYNRTHSTRSYSEGLTRYESASNSCNQYLSVIPSEIGSRHHLSRCSTLTESVGEDSMASTVCSKHSDDDSSEYDHTFTSTNSNDDSGGSSRYESSYTSTYSYTYQDDTFSQDSSKAANKG